MIKRIFILFLFINTSFANSSSLISLREKELIKKEITSLYQEICQCDDTQEYLDKIKIDEIERIWAPLVKTNRSLFDNLVKSLPFMVELNKSFTKDNDENYIGFSMYMLRLFTQVAASSGKVINGKDISLVLNVLEQEYQQDIPLVVKEIIRDLKELRMFNLKHGLQQLRITTVSGRPISIDMTHPDLLGKQEDSRNKIRTIEIKNNASIYFADKIVNFTDCRIGKQYFRRCKMAEVGREFFTNRSDLTEEYQTIPRQVHENALNYFSNKSWEKRSISPLYIKFDGITITGRFGGFNVDPEFKDAIVIPGSELPAFYLRVNVKAFIGIVNKTIEIAI